MKLAIYGRNFHEGFNEHITHLFKVLHEMDAEVKIYKPFRNFLQKEDVFNGDWDTFSEPSEIQDDTDYILSVGGDGTMLHCSLLVGRSGIPILGINTGRLGFLSSVAHENIEMALKELSDGKYTLDQRTLLKLETDNKLFGDKNFALNELTVLKKDTSSMITIHAYINDEYLNSYWSDGLIIATPTGSTGYSLSCGGPIVNPNSESLVITPIAPHNLNVRPFVVSDKSVIKLQVEGRSDKFLASLDSRPATIDSSMELTVKKAGFHINLIRLSDESFYSTLRNKMMWGMDRRN